MTFPSRTFVDYQGNIPAEWLNAVDEACSGGLGSYLLADQTSLDIVTSGGPEAVIGRLQATPTRVQLVAGGGSGIADVEILGDNVRLPEPGVVVLGNSGTLSGLLAGKANTSHTHTIANVTGLQAALDSKFSGSQPTLTIVDAEAGNPDSRKLIAIADLDGITTLEATHWSTSRLGLRADRLDLPDPSSTYLGTNSVQTLLEGRVPNPDGETLVAADSTDHITIRRLGAWYRTTLQAIRNLRTALYANTLYTESLAHPDGPNLRINVANPLTVSGNIDISGLGRKITADLTSSPGRLVVQNSVPNQGSIWSIVPNGTANSAQTNAHNSADWQNSTLSRCGVFGTEVFHTGNASGTGAPCTLYRWGPSQVVSWTMDASGVVTGAGGAAKFGNSISAPVLVAGATGVAGDAEVICINNLGRVALLQNNANSKGIACQGPLGEWDGWLVYRPSGTNVAYLGVSTPSAAAGSEAADAAFVRGRVAEAAFASGSTPTWQEVWIGASTSVAGSALTGGALAGVYRVVSSDDYEGASGVVSIGGSVENTAALSVSNGGVGVLSVLTLRFTSGSFILAERILNVGAGTFTDTPKTITAIYRLV